VTERLVIRCWDPRDAPLASEAVQSSLDELRPWMPWAHEQSQSPADVVNLLRRFRGAFDLDQNFVYGIFSPDEREVVGGTGLHARVGEGAFEIGYWIRTSRTGEGLATETAAALTRVAFEVCGVERVELHVDPANARSLRIPHKLGYTEEGTLRRRLAPPPPESVRRDVVVFSMLADEFSGSPLVSAPLEAYDAVGGRVL
jgi:RimJ/RimL family protein N-acetyltransferase